MSDNDKPAIYVSGSGQAPQIYALIPKIMAMIGGVTKDGKNEQQGYKFRGIEQFYKAAHPAFIAHGVFCCPQVLEHESTERATANAQGQPRVSFRVILKVSHRFYASDGSYVNVITCGEGIDTSDKATNKAMSAAMKYALIELFSVPTEDIEDADKTSPELGAKTKPVATTTAPVTFTKPVGRPVAGRADPAGSGPGEAEGSGGALPPSSAPADTPIPGGITAKQSGMLHHRFRESLREDLRDKADLLLYDFLRFSGYKREDGTTSALLVPAELFAEIGKASVKHAREL